jgi:hypothetical protein
MVMATDLLTDNIARGGGVPEAGLTIARMWAVGRFNNLFSRNLVGGSKRRVPDLHSA